MFEEEFKSILLKYDTTAGMHLFSEIELTYGQSSRHYHNLSHLDQLLIDLKPFRQEFSCWDTLVFAIAYHDFVYEAARNDNEEKSADAAKLRLQSIQFPVDEITRCGQFILATKKHETVNREIALFTDADLAILGADQDRYQKYAIDVRKEYSFYPDFLYNPGRRKVLKHFLSMKRVYKTDEFFNRYEHWCRHNLKSELESLS